jgi:uncharacterized protein (TIGR00725 family)
MKPIDFCSNLGESMPKVSRRPIIAVLGGRHCDAKAYNLAYEVGRLIAESKAILLCGGRSGVMEAACKGATENGGLTIAILPDNDASKANPWVQIAIPTGLGIARNSIIVRSCDAAIAIGGKYGTLSEIAYCLQTATPVCALNSWELEDLPVVQSAEEAITFVFSNIK